MRFFSKSFVALAFLTSSIFSDYHLEPTTEQEAFFIRRIIEYYEENDFQLFQKEIENFLTAHPKSALKDDLLALLADHFMKEEKLDQALENYRKINSFEVRQKVILNYLQALYQAQNYEELLQVAEPHLDAFSSNNPQSHYHLHFLYAESMYRLAIDPSKNKKLRIENAQKAISLLEKLTSPHKSLEASYSLAHLYYITKQFAKSSSLYLELAEKDPSEKEKNLFKAATIQMHFDKPLAAQTFMQICHIGKDHAEDAAYNRMILLFDLDKFSELILAKDQLLRTLSKEKKPLLHFLLGQSHFQRKDLKRSIVELKTFLSNASNFAEQQQIALFTLAEIANTQEDLTLFDEVISQFPKEHLDEKMHQAIFAHGVLCKKKKLYREAKEDFSRLLQAAFNEENVLFEYAHLLFELENFQESREHFLKLVQQFPKASDLASSLNYFVQSSLNLSEKSQTKEQQGRLIEDIRLALDQKKHLSAEDKCAFTYLLAKTYYQLNSFKESKKLCNELLHEKLSSELHRECHLLLSNIYINGFQDHESFRKHAEKALESDPSFENNGKVHLALFNSYLHHTKNGFDKAKTARHLFSAINAKENIKKENLFWLADFFWKEEKDMQKAIQILELALPLETLKETAFPYEEEIIKLARLYNAVSQQDKCLAILEQLEVQYLQYPDKNWKYPKQVRFELAKQHERKENFEKAVIYYDEVVKNSFSFQEEHIAKSALQAARIRLNSLSNDDFKVDNPIIEKILHQLKNLTIQRSLINEPVHFEAAFEYVDLRSRLENPSNFAEKKLSLLEKMKQKFSSKNSIIDKEYHMARKGNSDKQVIYSTYMRLLDSEILATQALVEQDNKELKDKAQIAFKELQSKSSLNPFLQKRIEKNISNLTLKQ
ncbi:MAG: hypothetical protein COT84_08655 [Chlamydiae bacterium CG10_big_fil_rev_8_21_14_0_10_35_9]|nr:MAG: hypothetical protein COT84_08655 [Chlamydiae bacterium CG10_big_fil_rev_8_21_14_0_10_35_9]